MENNEQSTDSSKSKYNNSFPSSQEEGSKEVDFGYAALEGQGSGNCIGLGGFQGNPGQGYIETSSQQAYQHPFFRQSPAPQTMYNSGFGHVGSTGLPASRAPTPFVPYKSHIPSQPQQTAVQASDGSAIVDGFRNLSLTEQTLQQNGM